MIPLFVCRARGGGRGRPRDAPLLSVRRHREHGQPHGIEREAYALFEHSFFPFTSLTTRGRLDQSGCVKCPIPILWDMFLWIASIPANHIHISDTSNHYLTNVIGGYITEPRGEVIIKVSARYMFSGPYMALMHFSHPINM